MQAMSSFGWEVLGVVDSEVSNGDFVKAMIIQRDEESREQLQHALQSSDATRVESNHSYTEPR